jgi:hypothetical protein
MHAQPHTQEDDHHEEALAALGDGYAGLFKKRTKADKGGWACTCVYVDGDRLPRKERATDHPPPCCASPPPPFHPP